MAHHHHAKLRFECTACGACCFGGRGAYVALSGAEADAIRRHLGLSTAWFRRRYLVSLANGRLGLRLDEDGWCSLLDAEGRCRAYAARPGQCRSYPFWPEVVATANTWRAEAARCEGIGRGAVVPLGRIEAMLKLAGKS
ncbi:MAG TPA: YkgJ family cysteine cluster protein [Gammaproteobacteria bacterium]|nr:YkgJ family cysteine cluster protein [Gammaproteobacteria bacterium]